MLYLGWQELVWRHPVAALIDHMLPVPAAWRMASAVPEYELEQSSSSDCTHVAIEQCRDAKMSCCLGQFRAADGR